MRKDVKKYLFFGSKEDKGAFFSRAQNEGVIQFIDPKGLPGTEVPIEVSRLRTAIKTLRGLEPLPQEELDDIGAADRIATRICQLHEQIVSLEEEKRVLAQEIARVHVFGDYALEDIGYLEDHGRTVQFFFCKGGRAWGFDDPDLIYIGSDHALDYFVSIAKEPRTYAPLTEMRIERPLGLLEKRMEEANQEIHAAEEELKPLAKRKHFLEKALIGHLNKHNLLSAQEHVEFALGDQVFAVEGWVAEHQVKNLAKISGDSSVHFEEILIEEGDHVPTFLDNEKFGRIGEDLVHIYDTPSIEDRDPSRWVLWFFAFFFAIIINDAGYGLVLLGTSLWLSMKFGKRPGLGGRFTKLCLILSVSVILWGTLTSSFFGLTIGPDNPLRKVSLTSWMVEKKVEYVLERPESESYKEWVAKYPKLSNEKTVDGWINGAMKEREGTRVYDLLDSFTNNIMIELAVMIGVIHLILSFLRVIDRNWAGAGWILFMVGGYLFFPSMLKATSIIHFLFGVPKALGATIGLELLYIGLGGAVVLAFIQKRLKGLGEIANVIQVFADTLSYLRLYALGLAGGMMSATFNDIGSKAGWVFGFLIILVGHIVNIGLSIVGGIIHGLRLNFLEWYRHCFEGGGKMLQPLRLLKIRSE